MKGAIVFAVLLVLFAGSEGIWISRVMPQKFWKVFITHTLMYVRTVITYIFLCAENH